MNLYFNFNFIKKKKINTGGEDMMDPCITPCSKYVITGKLNWFYLNSYLNIYFIGGEKGII